MPQQPDVADRRSVAAPIESNSPTPNGTAGRRLAVLLGAVLLLLSGSFAAITAQDHAATLEDGWLAAERAARGAAEHAAVSLDAARMVTDRVADAIRRDGPGRFRGAGSADLTAMLPHAPQLASLWVMDATGRLVASSLDPAPPPADFSDRPYYAPLRDGAETHLTPLLRGRVTGVWFFSFNRAVRSPAGEFLGIILGAVRAQEFQRFQAGLGLGREGRVGLFRARDGELLMLHPLPPAADDEGAQLAPTIRPPAEIMRAAADGQRSGRFFKTTPEGVPLLLAWTLAGRPGEEVLAAAALPRPQALAPFRARLARNALLFGLAAAAVGLLGWAVATAVARGAADRRATEAGRRELAAVLEATGDGVFALDPAWRFTFMNRRGAALAAAERDVVGRIFQEAYPDTGPFEAAFRRTMTERVPASAEAFYPPLGRWFRAESHPREDGGIVVFFRDVTETRAAEARLAEGEARFRAMADNIPQLAWMARPDGWIFWFNRRWFDYTGTNLAEMEGWGWRAVHHPDHLAGVVERLSRALESGAPWEDTFPLRGRDGTYRWFLSRAMPVRDPEGRIALWFGTSTDVTQRRATEAALAESEARLRQVLDSLFAFVGVLSPDGTLLEANRAPLEASGLALEDVRGKLFWDCPWWSYDPQVQAEVRAACERAAAGETVRYDVAVRMKGDSRMTIDFQIAPLRDAAGRVTHLIPSAADVTARARAEAALAESEARLRLAQEGAGIGVFERDLLTHRVWWSAAMFEVHGLAGPGGDADVAEETVLSLVHPEDRASQLAAWEALYADVAQAHFRFEYRICRPDNGEVRWVASRGEVVREPDGRPLLVRGVTYDITERRRAEDRQMLLAREVDHRAKNALAVVQAIVGLTRNADPQQFREAVTGRIAAMARAHTLLAREGWGSAELRELIEEELAPHRADASGAVVRVTLSGPPVALAPGAAQPLAMALHELATNAVKYGALSAPAGRVAIGWERREDGGLMLRWTERGGPPLAGQPERRGFGSSVIRNTVERQLGGTSAFAWPEEGVECTLTLPPEQTRWPAEAAA